MGKIVQQILVLTQELAKPTARTFGQLVTYQPAMGVADQSVLVIVIKIVWQIPVVTVSRVYVMVDVIQQKKMRLVRIVCKK